MKVTFDYYHNLEQVDLYLCNPDGRELFTLPGKNRNLTLRFNDLSELTFEVGSNITLSDNTVVNLEVYDYIQTKRLVYATNIGWFQISAVDEHDNGVVKYKSITAESYQSVLKNKGFISEERVYCFYNPNDPRDERYDSTNDGSIPSVLGQWSKQLGIKQALGQGLAEPDVPYDDWTVTYVNPSLIYTGTGSKCRTFKESVTFGYDWIVNDVEEAFGVIVLFDFMYKTIHVMTPDEVAQKVNVIYTFNNFMKSIDVEEKSDDIVTVLSCNGDNCDITGVNPTGTNYICDFSYFMDKVNYRWMSAELINKLEQWKSDCDAEKSTYEEHIKDLRTLYKSKTEKKTLLQEMSLILTDLKTVMHKRTVFESEDPGTLCGIVMAETVAKGANSIKEGTKYYTTKFSGDTIVKAYQFQPNYNREMRRWEWDNSGESTSGTVNDIIASNLSDTNTSGCSYWYFSDVDDGSSYCKLKSAVTVNKDTVSSTYYCSGFERYIAYVSPLYIYPMPRRADIPSYDSDTRAIEDVFDDLKSGNLSLTEIIDKYGFSGKQFSCSVYMDSVSEWVNLYEKKVSGLNSKIRGLDRDIASVSSKLEAISSRLNILRYMSDTPALLRELNCYWIEGDYTNENIAVLEQTTPEEELDLSNELLGSGYIELSKVCQPRFSFSVESVDATKQYEFRAQMRLLELGKIITIEKDEGIWYYPALLEISINLDNSEEFSMAFANALRLDDWGYTYADLISDASSTSRQVSANWQDILAYSKERAEITSLIKDPLDVTLRASFANMVNQEFTVDKTGILGRKRLSETSEDFEDEQVRLINNLLIFTDDNWETAKTALGKIHYTDENGNPVTSYGLIAETIIGSLIMGERLKIINKNSTIELGAEGITVKKEDGTEVFSAKPDGTLLVKGYANQGALDAVSSELSVTKTELSAKVSSTGGNKSSFAWSLKPAGFYLYSSSTTPVMSVTKDGAVFSGSLSAATGTFAGELSAAKGTFAGELSAATGTLGDLTVTGTMYLGGNHSYYISANYDDADYYVNLPGLQIDEARGAVFTGRLKAATGTFEGELSAGTIIGGDLKIKGDKIWFEMLDNGDSLRICDSKRDNYLHISQTMVYICSSMSGYASSIALGSGVNNLTGYDANFSSNSGHFSGTWSTASAFSVTSDINAKNTIAAIDDKYDTFFDNLRPVTYKYNDGTSGRLHTGFIAQEVGLALESANIPTADFAGFVIHTKNDGNKIQLLRYEEFVSINTWQIQRLKARVAELESIVAKLQET